MRCCHLAARGGILEVAAQPPTIGVACLLARLHHLTPPPTIAITASIGAWDAGVQSSAESAVLSGLRAQIRPLLGLPAVIVGINKIHE